MKSNQGKGWENFLGLNQKLIQPDEHTEKRYHPSQLI